MKLSSKTLNELSVLAVCLMGIALGFYLGQRTAVHGDNYTENPITFVTVIPPLALCAVILKRAAKKKEEQESKAS